MRYLHLHIQKDLQKKMVFLGGPRQAGKTTLAQALLKDSQGHYFNWDFDEDRSAILKKTWKDSDRLLIFDELHKFGKWKNWIKGLYDVQKNLHQFLVTGSARLDIYRRGGDSLLGRYHYWRLHPFSLSEIPEGISKEDAFERLMTVGGFPEPFLDNDLQEARRWRRERLERVIKDDVRDLEPIRDIQTLALFVDQLRTRVGSPVVLSNIAEDLQISPKTAKRWLETLEKMYLVFAVYPYTKNLPRATQKPPKVYFFDNSDVIGDEGAVFENLVATHLLKHLQFREDLEGYRYELKYIRDKEKREVDFVILKDGMIQELIEVKYADPNVDSSLKYYAEKLNPPKATQIVARLKRPYSQGKLTVDTALNTLDKL
jgi:predicted AAA+ superfamily ATPase